MTIAITFNTNNSSSHTLPIFKLFLFPVINFTSPSSSGVKADTGRRWASLGHARNKSQLCSASSTSPSSSGVKADTGRRWASLGHARNKSQLCSASSTSPSSSGVKADTGRRWASLGHARNKSQLCSASSTSPSSSGVKADTGCRWASQGIRSAMMRQGWMFGFQVEVPKAGFELALQNVRSRCSLWLVVLEFKCGLVRVEGTIRSYCDGFDFSMASRCFHSALSRVMAEILPM